MADNNYNIMLTDARIIWQNAENAFTSLKNAEIVLADSKKIPIFFYNSGHSAKYTDKNAYSNKEDDDYSLMVGTTIDLSAHLPDSLSADGYSNICKTLYDNLLNYISSFAGTGKQSNMNNTNVEVTLCHDDEMKEGLFSKNTLIVTDEINEILKDDAKYKKIESGDLGKTYEEVGRTCIALHTKMPKLFSTGTDEENKPTFIMLRTTYGIV